MTVRDILDKINHNNSIKNALYGVDIHIKDSNDVEYFDKEELLDLIDEYNEMLKDIEVKG